MTAAPSPLAPRLDPASGTHVERHYAAWVKHQRRSIDREIDSITAAEHQAFSDFCTSPANTIADVCLKLQAALSIEDQVLAEAFNTPQLCERLLIAAYIDLQRLATRERLKLADDELG